MGSQGLEHKNMYIETKLKKLGSNESNEWSYVSRCGISVDTVMNIQVLQKMRYSSVS